MDDVVHDPVVEIRERVHEHVLRRRGPVELPIRNIRFAERRAEVLFVVINRLHRDQVYDALEGIARSYRQHDRHGVRAEPVVHHFHGVLEIGADPVHLVDEREPRYVIPVGLPPDRLRLRLDSADAAEYRDETVENPQAALDLDREIDVPRGVDDVDGVIRPLAGRRGGHDRDPPFPLLLHPVHHRASLVHLAHPMDPSGIEENPLRQGSLARIDVGRYPDVADLLKRKFSGHKASPRRGFLTTPRHGRREASGEP